MTPGSQSPAPDDSVIIDFSGSGSAATDTYVVDMSGASPLDDEQNTGEATARQAAVGGGEEETLDSVVVDVPEVDRARLEDFLEGNEAEELADPRPRETAVPVGSAPQQLNLREPTESCCYRAAKATYNCFEAGYSITAGLFGKVSEYLRPSHPYVDPDAEAQKQEDEFTADRLASTTVRKLGLGCGTKGD